MRLLDILRDTYIYKHDVAEAREEECQAYLQSLQRILMTIIQAKFKRQSNLARKQLELITDVTVLNNLVIKVATASTQKEVRKYLLTWQQTDQSDE